MLEYISKKLFLVPVKLMHSESLFNKSWPEERIWVAKA